MNSINGITFIFWADGEIGQCSDLKEDRDYWREYAKHTGDKILYFVNIRCKKENII